MGTFWHDANNFEHVGRLDGLHRVENVLRAGEPFPIVGLHSQRVLLGFEPHENFVDQSFPPVKGGTPPEENTVLRLPQKSVQ